MWRRTLTVLGTLTLVAAIPLGAGGSAEVGTLYLGSDGFPQAGLQSSPPSSGDLSNFDPGRDVSPGLLLRRSTAGLGELDPARYQHWQTPTHGMTLRDTPNLVIWAASASTAPSTGAFTAYLLDCPQWGEGCSAISAVQHQFDATEDWTETIVSFPATSHTVDAGRALGVRIVVSHDSETDLLFAYDRLSYRSRLVFTSEPLAPVAPSSAAVASTPLTEEPVVSVIDAEVVDADPTASAAASPSSGGDLWEWVLVVAVSSLMVGTLAVVLLNTLNPRGAHLRRSGLTARFRSAIEAVSPDLDLEPRR